jgi:hypothetical protein
MTARERANALVVQLAELAVHPMSPESIELLSKDVPAGELTWNTHFTEAPGVGDIMIAGPQAASLTTRELGQLGILAAMAHKGFYNAAAKGIEFVSTSDIADRFGRTVDQNYSGTVAGPAFLQFAKTYWSFRVVESGVHDEKCNTIACSILTWLDTRIAPLFFPMPTAIPASTRRLDQRRFLEMFAPQEMDIEDFLAHNPILAASPGNPPSRMIWLWAGAALLLIVLITRC